MEGLSTVVKKKRSSSNRRPWVNPQSVLHNRYLSHNDEYELSLKSERNNNDHKAFNGVNSKQLPNDSESVLALLAPTNNDPIPSVPAENKPIKVRLKLTGLSGTVRASGPTEPLWSSDQQKLRSQDNSDDNCSPQEKSNGLQRDSRGKVEITGEAVSKGKRLLKRGVSDASFGGSDEDDEVRYLKKLGASKFATKYTPHYQNDKDAYGTNNWKFTKGSKVSSAYHLDDDYVLPSGWTTKSRKRSRLEKDFSDADYLSESKRKKHIKSADILTECKLQPLTTRQRALQSGNDGDMSSLIEFPNGLPLARAKDKSVKLSEEEKQAKKAEAALRRKMQAEKAARESEAKTIRKILGLDSEEKKKKAEKEKARANKAKAADSELLSNTVRLVMGPNGTVVIFPKGVALPSVFDSKPCGYPPPREKCAGPSCTNSYKYRDSRSNLPLCSLLCYRAVQGSACSVTTC